MSIQLTEQVKSLMFRNTRLEAQIKEILERLEVLEKKEKERKTLGLNKNG